MADRVADRETIAATLVDAILSNKPLLLNEESAVGAVEFYHLVLAALTKSEADANREQFNRAL
jgi:hypothetical protein